MVKKSYPVTQAKATARLILKSLAIRNPDEIDVDLIAWERGALVKETPLTGCEGRLVRSRRSTKPSAIISVNADIAEFGKKRFVTAHELGHFELHTNSDQFAVYTDINVFYCYQKGNHQEAQANAFAAELLMPEALFKPKAEKLEPDLEDIGHLASEFRTSLTATAMRYVKLSDSRCALVQSEKNAIKWIERSESFGHWVNIGDDLHPHTAAADFFKGKEIETGKCDVLAHTWLEGDIHSNSVIWEHSIAMPRYNAVLTLLSIDEDFEDPDEDFEDYRSEAKWARW